MIRTVWHWRSIVGLAVVVFVVGYGLSWVMDLDFALEGIVCFLLGSLMANLWMLRFPLWHFEF